MAIVKMKEFSLYFLKKDKLKILDELQAFGGLEFRNFERYVNDEIDSKNENIVKALEKFKYLELDEKDIFNEQSLNKLKYCLEVLRPYVTKQPIIKSLTDDKIEINYEDLKKSINSNSWENIYDEFKNINSKISSLDSEYLKCISDIESNKNWENLEGEIKDYNNLRYTTCIFGSISKQFEQEIVNKFDNEFKLSSVQMFNSTQQESFFVIIVHNDIKQEVFEFLRFKGFNFQVFSYEEKVSDYLKTLENKKSFILREKDKLIYKIKSYESKYVDLQFAYEYFNSNVAKGKASQKFLESDSFLICEGYVEENNVDDFKKCLTKVVNSNFYLEFKDIELENSNDVPIKLSNGSIASPFESVLEMYSYPTYKEIDPTPIISIFFIIFFGMMLADAGYGLVITILSAFLYVKSKTVEKKNSYRLFIFTGISTIIWGILYGAYFGDLIQRYFKIDVPVVLDVNTDIMTIFIISIAFGFVHLILGLIMKAVVYFKNGKKIDVIYDVVSWLLILSGVLVFALQGIITVFNSSIATWLIVIGVLILLFTQGRESESIVGKIGGGVYGVYGVTGYIGDIISYSRLLALGLASGFIANAFNIMGGLIPFPFNLVITPLMLIPLHLFNLGINALGTYVHSARLQYLEFFGKFYTGGGRKFMPLKYTDKYIRIKK